MGAPEVNGRRDYDWYQVIWAVFTKDKVSNGNNYDDNHNSNDNNNKNGDDDNKQNFIGFRLEDITPINYYRKLSRAENFSLWTRRWS